MPKKISIDGVIGWDVLSQNIREELNSANGDSIELEINSPGGSVYEGFTIYNLLKKYKKDHNAEIKAVITGLAASMGSIIPLAADSIEVFDTSVYMIHLPWTLAIGNSEDLKVIVERLDKLATMSARVYSQKTKKELSDIMDLMKAETFFYGGEIVEGGFGDKLLSSGEEKDKEETLLMAQMSIDDAISKFSDKEKAEDLEKAVALYEIKQPEMVVKNKEEESMDLMDFLKENPEAKAEHISLLESAKAEGLNQERERVAELMEFATLSSDLKTAIDSGMSAGDFAKAELKAQKQSRDTKQNLGSFEPTENREEVEEPESKKVDDAIDAYFSKKRGEK